MERQFSEQEQVRRDKLEEIKNYWNPYPERYEVTHKIKDARLLEDGTPPPLPFSYTLNFPVSGLIELSLL